MIEQFLYLLFAIFSLGVLVFIHELGHYWMAKREGMEIEVFSIGFGPPIFSWMRDGVRWQVCWVFFGGYVKIAGMQREGSREPYEIAGGFFSKKPAQRIRVALMGPLVNIGFALAVFAFLWLTGGREKNFSEFTHYVGWVDSRSQLYQKGVRPGDRVDSYNGKSFGGMKDLLVAALLKDETTQISGVKIDAASHAERNFDYTILGKEVPFAPANYCIFEQAAPGSPLASTGIKKGDRILWADGETIYSIPQLHSTINHSSAFLTVLRGDEVVQARVPRIKPGELKLSAAQRAEFDDWQHEAEVKGSLSDVYFIPYLISPNGEVEARVSFLDRSDANGDLLREGDRILAVDGRTVRDSYELLRSLQVRRVLLIVQRDPLFTQPISWKEADRDFEKGLDQADLQKLIQEIGVPDGKMQVGNLILLPAVEPKPLIDVSSPKDVKVMMEMKKKIEAIEDSQKRQEALRQWEKEKGSLKLGIFFKDRAVRYNPGPLQQFGEAFREMGFVLKNLFTGHLHPKSVAGPIGIIQIVQKSWSFGGVKEALFWMAMISMNLGVVNLLPIPVLDGGHIMFSLYEAVTRRRLSSKTMERLIIPFIVLLVLLFIYITYQDILRLFTRFF